MPCYDSRDYSIELINKANSLTEMLCEACKKLESHRIPVSVKLYGWWEDHKLLDQERLEAEKSNKQLEKLRKLALAKLTSEEQRALGFKINKQRKGK